MGNNIEQKLEKYLADMRESLENQRDKHRKNSKNTEPLPLLDKVEYHFDGASGEMIKYTNSVPDK